MLVGLGDVVPMKAFEAYMKISSQRWRRVALQVVSTSLVKLSALA